MITGFTDCNTSRFCFTFTMPTQFQAALLRIHYEIKHAGRQRRLAFSDSFMSHKKTCSHAATATRKLASSDGITTTLLLPTIPNTDDATNRRYCFVTPIFYVYDGRWEEKTYNNSAPTILQALTTEKNTLTPITLSLHKDIY